MTAGATLRPPPSTSATAVVGPEPAASAGAIGVASWTLVSRVTGLARVSVAGATLGPTFFANTFLATNTVPNLAYNLLAGSLLATLVVPSLVSALDTGGPDRARAVVQGLTGVLIVGFGLVGVVVLALGPVLVGLLTLGVPPEAEAEARAQTWVLLLLVAPQVLLYGVAALGAAAQNARRRFRLAAAAPTVENLVLIATLVFAAQRFGRGFDTGDVPAGYLVLLGSGATLAVACHAGLQVFGAARAGLALRPRWGWADPAVRDVARRALPAVGTATLDAAALFTLVVAAGTVPGGVVALQVGLSFYNLPLAISGRAVGTVMLPQLALDAVRGRLDRFVAAYDRGVSATWFVVAPASVALVVMAPAVGRAMSFGELGANRATTLLTVSIATLAPALLGGATYELARQACYARRNAVAPLVAGIAQLVITVLGAVVAVAAFDGAATLAGCGLIVVATTLVQAIIADGAARRDVASGSSLRWRALARQLLVSLLTVAPLALLARTAADGRGRDATIAAIAAATVAGLVAYVGIQRGLRAPELTALGRRAPAIAGSPRPPAPVGGPS